MSTVIQLSRQLPYSTEQAWTLLTEPAEMNKWSTASIVPAEAGANDRMDQPGALRTVLVPGRFGTKLREVVQQADYPSVFEYRVYDGGPLLRNHLGTMVLTPHPAGCTLTWTVHMEFIAPALSRLVRPSLRKQLTLSLDRLASGDIAPPPVEAPHTATRTTEVDLAPLRREAEDILAEQRDIAAQLTRANDPKQWFARVYEIVSEEMLGVVDAGLVDHPDWVLRLIPDFHIHYSSNLRDYIAGRPVEPAWQKAWSRCERVDPDPVRPIVVGLLYGVSAHIEADLPRSLASVYRAHYRDTHDYREFLPDYLRLSPVFLRATDRLVAQMPQSYKPWWLRASTHVAPELREALLARRSYDVTRNRLEAFKRGHTLATA